MAGITIIILLLTWTQVSGSDHIQPPEGFRVTVPALGHVLLTWSPCVAPSREAGRVMYVVKIKTPEQKEEQYFTEHTESSLILAVHRGLQAQVAAALFLEDQEVSRSQWVLAELPPSPGAEGTAVTHLSCHIHTEESLMAALTCNWTPGHKAPADSQYHLYYGYEERTEGCTEYVTEPKGQRHVGCRVPSSQINLLDGNKFLVLVNGSSRSLGIMTVEHVYTPEEIEVLNPPRNVSALEAEGRLVLRWVRPLSVLGAGCFLYEVRTQNLRSGRERTVTVRNTEFVQGPLQEPLSQHSLQVRAVGITHCRKTALRSQWSEALFIGTTSWDRPEAEYVIALSVCLTVAGLVLMLVCVRFHFWRKLFPRVPRPRNGLKDLFLNTDMRSDTSEFDGEVVSYIEEIEEFRSEKFFQ